MKKIYFGGIVSLFLDTIIFVLLREMLLIDISICLFVSIILFVAFFLHYLIIQNNLTIKKYNKYGEKVNAVVISCDDISARNKDGVVLGEKYYRIKYQIEGSEFFTERESFSKSKVGSKVKGLYVSKDNTFISNKDFKEINKKGGLILVIVLYFISIFIVIASFISTHINIDWLKIFALVMTVLFLGLFLSYLYSFIAFVKDMKNKKLEKVKGIVVDSFRKNQNIVGSPNTTFYYHLYEIIIKGEKKEFEDNIGMVKKLENGTEKTLYYDRKTDKFFNLNVGKLSVIYAILCFVAFSICLIGLVS